MAHAIRQSHLDGNLIIKYDIKNAFNNAPRKAIAELIKCNDVLNYFQTVYGAPSSLMIYGSGDGKVIRQEEGVRQGDALSSFLFSLLMDKIGNTILKEFPDTKVWCYLDDLTVSIKPTSAARVHALIKATTDGCGLPINEAKTSWLLPDGTVGSTDKTVTKRSFVVVGACINNFYDDYNAKIGGRVDAFFDLLDRQLIHPQLGMTFLRLCGTMKLRHYCSVNPPECTQEVTKHFDERAIKTVEKIVQLKVPSPVIFDRLGAGLPSYGALHQQIYENSKLVVRTGVRSQVELLLNKHSEAHWRSQHDAQWLFYASHLWHSRLSPNEYVEALKVRLRISSVSFPYPCACGVTATHVGYSFRHNLVRDAIMRVCNSYGLSVTKEPTFYTYDDAQRRPDLSIHTVPVVVTDVTVVNCKEDVGIAATEAAKDKTKIHQQSVAAMNHVFIPFACEIWGHMDEGCTKFIETIAKDLPPNVRWRFGFEMRYATSCALARGRSATMTAMKTKIHY
jgi:hypothetical protein